MKKNNTFKKKSSRQDTWYRWLLSSPREWTLFLINIYFILDYRDFDFFFEVKKRRFCLWFNSAMFLRETIYKYLLFRCWFDCWEWTKKFILCSAIGHLYMSAWSFFVKFFLCMLVFFLILFDGKTFQKNKFSFLNQCNFDMLNSYSN